MLHIRPSVYAAPHSRLAINTVEAHCIKNGWNIALPAVFNIVQQSVPSYIPSIRGKPIEMLGT